MSQYLDNKQRKTLDDSGVLMVPNFFSLELIVSLRDAVKNVTDGILRSIELSEGGVINTENKSIDEVIVEIIIKYPLLQSIIYDRLQQMPPLLAIPQLATIQELASEVLNSKNLGVWPRVQLRMDIPGDEKNVINWHNDYMYNKGTQHSYTFWFPLVPLTQEMGLLDFAVGSHKDDGLVPTTSNPKNKFGRTIQSNLLEHFEIITPHPKPGDLVLFHSKTWHTGKLNNSQKNARLSGLFRIQNLNKLEMVI